MKYSKQAVWARFHKLVELRFEDQKLTSFGGVIVLRWRDRLSGPLFQRLHLKARLKQCFQPVKGSAVFGPHRIVLLLIVHLLLGFRRLRNVDYLGEEFILGSGFYPGSASTAVVGWSWGRLKVGFVSFSGRSDQP